MRAMHELVRSLKLDSPSPFHHGVTGIHHIIILRLSHHEVAGRTSHTWILLDSEYHWSYNFSVVTLSLSIPLATDCFAKAIRVSTSPVLACAHQFFVDSPSISFIEIHLYHLQCSRL
jgi:hypothetical protein